MHRNTLPAMPTVGAGSSQREDSPAHRDNYVYHATHGDPGFYHDAARRVVIHLHAVSR